MFVSFFKTNKLSQQNYFGFSLIEVLVSLAIFTMVVTISVGSLMSLIEVNARARSVHTAMTNLSFMLDSMTREIRTGNNYVCGDAAGDLPTAESNRSTADCPGGSNIPGSFFAFRESGKSLTDDTQNDSRWVGYRVNDGVIQRRLGNESWVAVTDDNITITKLNFYVDGTDTLYDDSDVKSPTVLIYISGYVTARGTQETFDIQTTVGQELLDV